MERRRALAIAAATAATTMGAMAAIITNLGLLGSGTADSSPLGKLDAGTVAEVVKPDALPPPPPQTAPGVIVRYEDVDLRTPVDSTPSPAVATPSGEDEEHHDEDHEDHGRESGEDHEEEDDD